MHEIEPYYRWRDYYIAAEDERSPFFKREYDEFQYSQKIYNYFLHPQWDTIGSPTLYIKILFTDYIQQFSILELIGEWNDCINNDIMFLKREVIDNLTYEGISKFLLIGENVLNFHGSDDCYYEEWYDDMAGKDGWITMINLREHVIEEMDQYSLASYLNYGYHLIDLNWRTHKPEQAIDLIENRFRKVLV